MKGSIIKRNKTYTIIIDIGRDLNGKRKQRWFGGYKTKREAENALPQLLMKAQNCELVPNNKITLKDCISDWFENRLKTENLSPTTIDGYKNIVNNHIIPVMGGLKLQEIKPYTLQSYFNSKADVLRPTTLQNHKRLLVSFFIFACDMELLDRNPMDKIVTPKKIAKQTNVLTIEECKQLLTTIQSNYTLKIPVILSLLLGLRRGECLGLRWEDINFNEKTLSVNQNLEYVKGELYFKEPKTLKSKRTMAIPDILINILKEHHNWQREMTLRSEGTWKNERNLVCTRKTTGEPVTPHVLSDLFRLFIKKNNFKAIRFHDLRHTNATLMLAAGISAKVASNRLGHSNISITLDLYSHVLHTIDMDAATKIDNIFSNAQ